MFEDLRLSFKQWKSCLYLTILSIKNDYKRTLLGTWWIFLNNLLMFIPFYFLFKHFAQIKNGYFIFALVGFFLWNFISASVLQGANAFSNAAVYLKEIKIPYSYFALKKIFRNLILFIQSFVVILPVMFYFHIPISAEQLLFIPMMAIISMNLLLVSLILSSITVFFKDIVFVISRLMNMFFFITPIFWNIEILDAQTQVFFKLNPFYSFIEIPRALLLGGHPSTYDYGLLAFYSCLNIAICYVVFGGLRKKIIYWL